MLAHYLISQPLIAGLLIMLVLVVFSDFKKRKIPNTIVLFGLVFSLIFQCIAEGRAGGISWFLGVTVGFLCFFPLYLLRGMAAGDVKLMMAVGGFLGYPLVIMAALYSLIAGGIMAVMYLIYNGKLIQLMTTIKFIVLNTFVKKTTGQAVYDFDFGNSKLGRMPYAQAIAVGTVIAWYLKAST
jgi:prepilin peptidase CpaA